MATTITILKHKRSKMKNKYCKVQVMKNEDSMARVLNDQANRSLSFFLNKQINKYTR